MNDLAKKRVWIYTLVGTAVLLVGVLLALIISYNTGDDMYQPPIDVPGDREPGDEDDDDVAVIEEKFALPMSGTYVVFRHYWHAGLSDEQKNMAMINNKTTDGVTLINGDNSDFDVIAPMSGTVEDIITGDRGKIVVITYDNVTVELHSLKNISVNKGDEVKAGDKIAVSTTNTLDTMAKSNVYMILKVKDGQSFKKINAIDFIGTKISEITYKK